jgi:hypothetical protein
MTRVWIAVRFGERDGPSKDVGHGVRWLTLVLWLAVVFGAPRLGIAASPEDPPELYEVAAPTGALAETSLVPPPNSPQPIELRVGIYVVNLVSLNEVENTFEMTGYLTETWTDPRLAFVPTPGIEPKRFYEQKDIWFPMLQFDNATTRRTVSGYLLTGDPRGTIRYKEKFSIELSLSLHLRSFPFDTQELEIVVHPFNGQISRLILTPDPDNTGVSSAPYAALALWDTGPITCRRSIAKMVKADAARSHLVFGIGIARHSEYYVFRIFVPLFLMVAISWGVLWIPPYDLQSQLVISVTTVLTLVAFSVAVSRVLPPVAYLTFYDGFFLVSFFFVMVTIAEAIVIHTMHGANHLKALKVRRITRSLFPAAFFLLSGIIAIVFLT